MEPRVQATRPGASSRKGGYERPDASGLAVGDRERAGRIGAAELPQRDHPQLIPDEGEVEGLEAGGGRVPKELPNGGDEVGLGLGLGLVTVNGGVGVLA